MTDLEEEAMGMPIPTTGEKFTESSYTPFKLMSYHLYQTKSDYEDLLRGPQYYNNIFRKRVIDSANILYRESKETGFTYMECGKLEGLIKSMYDLDNQITQILSGIVARNVDPNTRAVIDHYISKFQDLAYAFLGAENSALQNHGQLFKTKQRIEQIERLQQIFMVNHNNRFPNAFGIDISLETMMMARILAQRVTNRLDNFFPIEGDTGFGKTTFAWALGSTLADITGRDFNLRDNFIFNESTQYVEERIRSAERGDIIILDEFGNQANKRRFYEDGQINFMDRLKLLRFHGLTILPCWPSVDELDSQLKTKIHGIFTINKRTVAQLRTFNRNKYAKDKEYTPYYAKHMVAFTPEEGSKITEEFDEFNVLSVPFYEIPEARWAEYEVFKDSANKIGRQAITGVNARKQREALQTEFLIKLPDDVVRITSADFAKFSREKNFVLSFRALVTKICGATGQQRIRIYHMNPGASDPWDGYLDVDEFVARYIQKTKAQYQGMKQTGPTGEGNG